MTRILRCIPDLEQVLKYVGTRVQMRLEAGVVWAAMGTAWHVGLLCWVCFVPPGWLACGARGPSSLQVLSDRRFGCSCLICFRSRGRGAAAFAGWQEVQYNSWAPLWFPAGRALVADGLGLAP